MAPPSQPWADSPLQLIRTPFGSKDLRRGKAHGAHYIAQQMVHLHNSTIRLLNSIYNQAPYVRTPDDIQAFLAYIKHWHDEMYHHHMVEERLLFPRLEALIGQEGSMEANKEQHEAFEPGLKALGAYATSTKVEDYSGKRVQELIDDFGAILATHLADEIPTLIALENCDDKTIRKIWNEVFWFVLRTADPFVQLPMLMGSFDATWEDGKSGDLEIPAVAYPVTNWVFSRRHKKCWEFLPCTLYGQPRPLYAHAQ